MKKEQLVETVLAGGKLLVGEYRGTKVEALNWRDKSTGKALSAQIVRHTLELGQDSVMVTQRMDDGVDPHKVVWPFKKGQKVVFHVEELKTERGLMSGRGHLEELT